MMLIVNEKPSQARNFARALGGMAGTFDGIAYEITSLRGHVLELKKPSEQVAPERGEEFKRWSVESLPWDEAEIKWSYELRGDVRDVISKLKEALTRADAVAIATDDDPSGEGELLAWEALSWCGWDGPTCRLYFADEAPASIEKAFRERRTIESMERDGDYLKALARCRWDFLSMQFTRLATCAARSRGHDAVVRQGRLKTVMANLVGQQLEDRKNYVRKPYFEARFRDAAGVVYKRPDDAAERFDAAEKCSLGGLCESDIEIDSVKRKRKAPGKLLDLAALSAILAQKGHRADEVLSTYQRMYEDQVLSYPRTEDKFVTPEQFAELSGKVDEIARLVGVDPALLTHREPRKTHVHEGAAHGANRPGVRVPASLESLGKYGPAAVDMYTAVAKNYLAMLAEDYVYDAYTAHVVDFPEFRGTASVPVEAGYKAVFDSERHASDDVEAEEAAAAPRGPAAPFVHEGANKKPQAPTQKWLMARLEKHDVGTGASRTSTFAECCKGGDRALIVEKLGKLSLAPAGELSFALMRGTRIASMEATEELFGMMRRVGAFEMTVEEVTATAAPMVAADRDIVLANARSLPQGTGKAGAVAVGRCPVCGEPVIDRGPKAPTYSCSSNKVVKDDSGKWVRKSGCGFEVWKTIAGKKLTQAQIKSLLERGHTDLVKGFKSRAGKKFDAKLKLAPDGSGEVEFVFQDRKR